MTLCCHNYFITQIQCISVNCALFSGRTQSYIILVKRFQQQHYNPILFICIRCVLNHFRRNPSIQRVLNQFRSNNSDSKRCELTVLSYIPSTIMSVLNHFRRSQLFTCVQIHWRKHWHHCELTVFSRNSSNKDVLINIRRTHRYNIQLHTHKLITFSYSQRPANSSPGPRHPFSSSVRSISSNLFDTLTEVLKESATYTSRVLNCNSPSVTRAKSSSLSCDSPSGATAKPTTVDIQMGLSQHHHLAIKTCITSSCTNFDDDRQSSQLAIRSNISSLQIRQSISHTTSSVL